MIIITNRNDKWEPFGNMRCGEVFLNGDQDYCIRIPLVKDTEDYESLYNTVNLANGGLCHTDDDVYVLPLPNSELQIEF